MFRNQPAATGKTYRLAIAGLLGLSVTALAVTIWVMNDFLREQEIVAELITLLPPDGQTAAQELAGELRWQFRLSILVVLNLVVTAFTLVLLWRAYRSSQESLRDIKALAGDILSSMDQAVITTNLNGVVTSINRRGVEMLELTEDHVGRLIRELSDQLPLEQFRKATRETESPPEYQDFPILTRGTDRVLRAFCQRLHDREQEDIGDVIQLRDVTERVLMEDRMRRMERYMGLGSLAAGLHHEIKNPLAALSLHVQLMEEEFDDKTPDTIQEMLSVIKTEVARVGGVLEGFRDFASVDRLSRSELDLRKLIDRQVKLVKPKTDLHHIEMLVEIPDSIPPINVDRVRIEQVLLNLIVNAIDAMPQGGTLTIRATAVSPDVIHIEVIDTGSGIPDDLKNSVFDPYFTTKSDGTGMGLALCDKIARQHHGTLDFRSSPHGTTFDLILPIDGLG